MSVYTAVIHQTIRYTVEIEADSPEAAWRQIEYGAWDDTNNEVLHDRVQVYDEAEEHLLLDTQPDSPTHGGVT